MTLTGWTHHTLLIKKGKQTNKITIQSDYQVNHAMQNVNDDSEEAELAGFTWNLNFSPHFQQNNSIFFVPPGVYWETDKPPAR